jgi:aminopeptidase N
VALKLLSAAQIPISRIVRCLFWSGMIPVLAAAAPRLYSVENYDVSIRPDLAKQHLDGEVRIRVRGQTESPVSALELDAGELQITSVTEESKPQWFERRGSLLFIALTTPLYSGEHRTLTVRYQAGSSPGLRFFPDQVYTAAVRDWMPYNDSPGERATLHLSLAAPADLQVAASGRLTATHTGGAQKLTEWQLDSPASPEWFGFALGAFAENTSQAHGVKLRVLGAGTEVLEPTTAALGYLADRSGKSYPGENYTQVFIHGDVVRSLAGGLTLLPESDAQGLAKDPDKLWLLTRELAEQWYGMQLFPKDWSDLWLSEGVSAFLADTFLGQRIGEASYQQQIEHSRQIYNQLRVQEKDRALSYAEWTTREDADGEIPVYKGACFLDLVHELTGDSTFWERLRWYTSENWGQAVTSEDLQRAFAGISGNFRTAGKKAGIGSKGATPLKETRSKALDTLFDVWVYGIPPKTAKKKGER